MDQTELAVARILSLLLGYPVPADGDTRMESCPAWDSLTHIEIIVTVEEHFGVSFATGDIPLLTSQRGIVAKLKELGHA